MQRDLGRLLPLPLGAEPSIVDRVGERFVVRRRRPGDRPSANHSAGTWSTRPRVACSLGGAPRRRRVAHGVEEAGHQVGGAVADDAAHVQRVAHLAVERVRATAARTRRRRRRSAATIQAPPVPCRLTGTPAWRATAPSWATAGPEPRATASASRGSANSAQPAACAAASTSCTAPVGQAGVGERRARRRAPRSPAPCPARRSRCGTRRCCRVRSTPVASANTLGRPSNTKPTTPSGARRARTRPAVVVDRLGPPRRGAASLRAQPRSPSTMSARIAGGQHQPGGRPARGRGAARRRRGWPRRSARDAVVVGQAIGEARRRSR